MAGTHNTKRTVACWTGPGATNDADWLSGARTEVVIGRDGLSISAEENEALSLLGGGEGERPGRKPSESRGMRFDLSDIRGPAQRDRTPSAPVTEGFNVNPGQAGRTAAGVT